MEGKVCTKCKTWKLYDDFYDNKGTKDRKSSWCRCCTNESTILLQTKAREYVWSYLDTHWCVDCGENDKRVLDFDHDDRTTKEYSVGSLVSRGAKPARLDREIAKCTVRCANCHRKRTAAQFGWYATMKRGPEAPSFGPI